MLLKVETPFAVKVLDSVVAPVTTKVLLKVVAPVTPNVPPIKVLPVKVVAPVTVNIPLIVALLVTDNPVPAALKVEAPEKVFAPVPD